MHHFAGSPGNRWSIGLRMSFRTRSFSQAALPTGCWPGLYSRRCRRKTNRSCAWRQSAIHGVAGLSPFTEPGDGRDLPRIADQNAEPVFPAGPRLANHCSYAVGSESPSGQVADCARAGNTAMTASRPKSKGRLRVTRMLRGQRANHRIWLPCDNGEQNAGGSVRSSPLLFPCLHRAQVQSEGAGERGLRQIEPRP